jgi:hypothetical protein
MNEHVDILVDQQAKNLKKLQNPIPLIPSFLPSFLKI